MISKYRRRVLGSALEEERTCFVVWRDLECGHQFPEKKNTQLESYHPLKIKPARFRVCEHCRNERLQNLATQFPLSDYIRRTVYK